MKSTLHEWTTWEGGHCPVPTSAYVDLKLRSGRVIEGVVAGRYLWGRAKNVAGSDYENGGDIVAYRETGEAA